jgi:hypothetical protein
MSVALGAVGLGLGAVKSLFSHRPNYDKAIAALMASNPEGSLSAEDLAFGSRARSSAAEQIGQKLTESRSLAGRRFASRGITGPALDQNLADISQGGALATSASERAIQDMLNRIREGNRNWGRQKAAAVFGAQTGQVQQDQQRYDAQQAGFWNSALEYLPTLSNTIGGLPTKALSAAADYNAPVPAYRPPHF